MHVCMWQWNVFCPEITSCLRRMRSSTASSTRSCSPTTRSYGRPNYCTQCTASSSIQYIHTYLNFRSMALPPPASAPQLFGDIPKDAEEYEFGKLVSIYPIHIHTYTHNIYTHIDTKIVIIMYIFYVCCVSIRTYYVICGFHVVYVRVCVFSNIRKWPSLGQVDRNQEAAIGVRS